MGSEVREAAAREAREAAAARGLFTLLLLVSFNQILSYTYIYIYII